MAKLPAKDIGVKLCEALGLDPKQTRSITLNATAGKLARVRVVQYVGHTLQLSRYYITGQQQPLTTTQRLWEQWQSGEPFDCTDLLGDGWATLTEELITAQQVAYERFTAGLDYAAYKWRMSQPFLYDDERSSFTVVHSKARGEQ